LSHGTCSYTRMYINAAAVSVMLDLRHDFYNIIFKVNDKLYIAKSSAPSRKNFGCTPVCPPSSECVESCVHDPIRVQIVFLNSCGTRITSPITRNLLHTPRSRKNLFSYPEHFSVSTVIPFAQVYKFKLEQRRHTLTVRQHESLPRCVLISVRVLISNWTNNDAS
jgi:hypothetical protein